MKPFRLLDCVVSRDGRELTLYQRGDAFYIQIDGYDLMSSRAHGSEDALARLALEALGTGGRGRSVKRRNRPPRILVGGLGMGFTLRAVLDLLGEASGPGQGGATAGRDAEVVVAEAFPAVVEWNRGPLAHLAGRPLRDRRVHVVVGDVADRLAEAAEGAEGHRPYDVILLDVDNGPEAITLEGNSRLYTLRGLGQTFRALTPGGVLAVWSASNDPPFTDRLRRAGFEVAVRRARERACGKGATHVLFVARRPAGYA
ncbi:MAG: hypothetical protein ACLF0P_08425 [Thermoanaerobaculia bacterium]